MEPGADMPETEGHGHGQTPPTEPSANIERGNTAPEVPMTEVQPDGEEHVYLPGLLSDEFGLSRQRAATEIRLGTVTIDDVPVVFKGGVYTIPKSLCAGKTVVVKGGEVLSFAVQIPE
jgi:hypothetical protein